MKKQWYFATSPVRTVKSIMAVLLLIMVAFMVISCGTDKPTQSAAVTSVTDVDGNVYKVIKIGTQVWMAENLEVTHYRNGDSIPRVTGTTKWKGLTDGATCDLSNDVNNVATYGRLYNWYAVTDARNIAPVGWHVPSDAEWQMLTDFLGGNLVAGGKMKESGTAHWSDPNIGGTNESGFLALPGQFRNWDGNWMFVPDYNAFFWSATEGGDQSAFDRRIISNKAALLREDWDKRNGMSVRCVKD